MMTISPLGATVTPQPLPAPSPPPAIQESAAPVSLSAPPPVVTQAELEQALAAVRQAISAAPANSLEFSVDSASGKLVVQVMDRQTHQVIQQIPSASLLALAQSLDKMQGLLLKQQA